MSGYNIFYVNLSLLHSNDLDNDIAILREVESDRSENHAAEHKYEEIFDILDGGYRLKNGIYRKGVHKYCADMLPQANNPNYKPVYGIQTNEASLKTVLQHEVLDELIILATTAVYTPKNDEKPQPPKSEAALDPASVTQAEPDPQPAGSPAAESDSGSPIVSAEQSGKKTSSKKKAAEKKASKEKKKKSKNPNKKKKKTGNKKKSRKDHADSDSKKAKKSAGKPDKKSRKKTAEKAAKKSGKKAGGKHVKPSGKKAIKNIDKKNVSSLYLKQPVYTDPKVTEANAPASLSSEAKIPAAAIPSAVTSVPERAQYVPSVTKAVSAAQPAASIQTKPPASAANSPQWVRLLDECKVASSTGHIRLSTDSDDYLTLENIRESSRTTTLGYFLDAIDTYAKNVLDQNGIFDVIKSITIYPIDNISGTASMTECATHVAEQIISAKEAFTASENHSPDDSLHLYVDSNGGLRQQMIIQTGIIRALQSHGISLKHVLYSNFNPSDKNWGDVPVLISDAKQEYNIFDIVSGIDEFRKYGRAYALADYFKNSKSHIKTVLANINKMSEAFSTCFAQPMIEAAAEVVYSISDFDEDPASEYLERYVVDEIRKDLGQDLTNHPSNHPDYSDHLVLPLIEWCFHKEFYQQAITLYVEKLPDWYFEKNILSRNNYNNRSKRRYPSFYSYLFPNDAAEQVRNNLNATKTNMKNRPDNEKRTYVNQRLENMANDQGLNLNRHYVEDMIQFIESHYNPDGSKSSPYRNDYNIPKDLDLYLNTLMKNKYGYGILSNELFCENDDVPVPPGECSDRDSEHAQTLFYHTNAKAIKNLTNDHADRIVSIRRTDNKDILSNIMKYYLAAKLIRNNSDHADGMLDENEQLILKWLKQQNVFQSDEDPVVENQDFLYCAEYKALLENAIRFNKGLLTYTS